MWSTAVLAPALPGRSRPDRASPGVDEEAQQWVEAETAFVGGGRLFLLRMAGHQRCVDVQDQAGRQHLGRQRGTGWVWLDQDAYRSESWAGAEGLQTFLLRNGGKEVARTQARPGEIIFYEQVAPPPSRPKARPTTPRSSRR